MADAGLIPDAPGEHHLHHLVWEAQTHMTPLIDEAFAGAELTLAMAGTLDQIGLSPGVTVADLARRTPKTQQAISQLVAKLEKLSFIERRVGPGRGVGLWITPAGESARADGIEREARIEAALSTILGAEVAEQLRAALELTRDSFRARPDRLAGRPVGSDTPAATPGR